MISPSNKKRNRLKTHSLFALLVMRLEKDVLDFDVLYIRRVFLSGFIGVLLLSAGFCLALGWEKALVRASR